MLIHKLVQKNETINKLKKIKTERLWSSQLSKLQNISKELL